MNSQEDLENIVYDLFKTKYLEQKKIIDIQNENIKKYNEIKEKMSLDDIVIKIINIIHNLEKILPNNILNSSFIITYSKITFSDFLKKIKKNIMNGTVYTYRLTLEEEIQIFIKSEFFNQLNKQIKENNKKNDFSDYYDDVLEKYTELKELIEYFNYYIIIKNAEKKATTKPIDNNLTINITSVDYTNFLNITATRQYKIIENDKIITTNTSDISKIPNVIKSIKYDYKSIDLYEFDEDDITDMDSVKEVLRRMNDNIKMIFPDKIQCKVNLILTMDMTKENIEFLVNRNNQK